MRAIVYTKYGPPDVFQLEDVDKPVPGDDEVLVKVYAASVNSADVTMSKGSPFLVRVWSGLLKPKNRILGADIAGRVESVGRNAKQYQPGDEVFGDISGDGWGGFAEYVAVSEDALLLKPKNLEFEEAAAVPQAAVVALQGLRNKGQIEPGMKVLINGASGGIGSYAVQIAKSFGAEVTGVCSTKNLGAVRSHGADHAIDYTQEDFTQNEGQYDVIFDIAGHHSLSDYKRALSPTGVYVGSVNSTTLIFQTMLFGSWISMTGSKKMVSLMAEASREDLGFVKELLEAGKVVPVIDRQYPLSEVSEAIRYYGKGHAQGKVVITVANNSKRQTVS